MSDDAPPPAPSLFLARNDIAHREHQHQHRHHHHIHQRQAGTTVQEIQSVVTEVVATVSYLQQIDVDSTGSTFSTQVVLAPTPSTTENSAAPATTTPASPSATHDSASGASSTNSTQASTASQSLSSSLEATSSLTSTPSSAFPSLAASSNSTTLISSSSSLSAATFSSSFSNSSTTSSTLSSSISSSLTYSTSSSLSSSSSTSSESSTTSTSSLYSPSSSSYQATSTGAGGIGAGGTGVNSGGAPSSTAASGNNSTSNSDSSSTTPRLLGGVLGGLAGLALIGFLLLLLIKWWKRKQSMISLGNGNEGDQVRDLPPSQPSGGMSQRRSLPFAVPAALATLTGYNKRASQKTTGTVSSTAGSERGFYRVSGRKLPSVLQTGGDGYGGGVHDSTLSGSSFYRDSTGFYGGPGSPPPTSFPPPPERDSGVPVMRPSPARTPVTEHGPFGRTPTPPPLTPPLRPDMLGRSHPSQDGSHASRFTEEV